MKRKLTIMVAMAAACAAIQLTAMPTAEETRRAEPAVQKLLASERAALKSGKKKLTEVADAAMRLAGEADTDAAKLLLMKGAFVLYVQDGKLEKAVETMNALEAAIADMPPQSVTNMIKTALLGVSKKVDGAQLYKLLDEKRGADRPNVKYKFSYKLEGGNAIITGIDPKPAGTVVIPDKIDGHWVTRIEGYNDRSPFWGCDQLTRVVLPAGLDKATGLDEASAGAFMSCKSLSSIEISRSNKKFTSLDGVLYSKDFSTLFVYPKTRESLKLSPKTRRIGGCAFRGCALKGTAKVPEGIEHIGTWSFAGCKNLESVEFPRSLKSLGVCPVAHSDNVKKIVFNGDAPRADIMRYTSGLVQELFTAAPADLVVEVRRDTKGWKSPNSTELPDLWPTNQKYSRPICYIGEARSVNNGVAQIKDAKATVDGYTWSYRVKNGEATIVAEKNGKHSCAVSPTPTGEVTIPPTLNGVKVTSIGSKAFQFCRGLTAVTIPENVTSIGAGAFFLCRGLRSLTIPPNVQNIGFGAFWGCGELTSVTIPAKVASIGAAAFFHCSALKEINVDAGNQKYASIDGVLYTKDQSVLLKCPNAQTSVTIPSSVKRVEAGAFGDCRFLKSITIPDGVTDIGDAAFAGCNEITSFSVDVSNPSYSVRDGLLCSKDGTVLVVGVNGNVTIPSCVKRIKRPAFYGYSGLTSVTIPEGVEVIEWDAFQRCTSLTSVTIPSSVTNIGTCAFCSCSGLKSVTILANKTDIRHSAFKDCGELVSVTMPSSMLGTIIGHEAFRNCRSLTSITIPSGVTNIEHHAFAKCGELASVTMLGERPDASNDIFQDCAKLKSIHVPANAKSWAGMKEWQGIPLVFDAEAAESRLEQSRYMIVDLDKTGKDAVSYLDDAPNGGWSDEYRTTKIALRRIEPGSFEYMPGRSFKITKPFYIGVFEVTQKQYEMTMKENPAVFKGDMRPVENMSYIDIRGGREGLNWPQSNKVDDDSYLGKLRKRIGLEFDLPTEAQWEYACRAGTKGDFNIDGAEIIKLGKCADNGGHNDHHVKVGSFLPNAWGFYDMDGNVWEWCLDRGPDGRRWIAWTTDAKETDTDPKGPAVGSSRLHRGGGWWDGAFVCRSGRRPFVPAGDHNSLIGFRLACPADGLPMKLSTDEKLHELKTVNGNAGVKDKAKMASSGKETIDGIEWSYRIIDGQAQVDYAVSSNVTGLITIPSTLGGCPVTSIGRNDFRSGFGWRVFEKCCNMLAVVIPSGVINIGDSAFFGCSNMVSVTIPSSVTNIARSAFSNCGRLTSFAVDGGNTKYSSRNGLLCSKDGATLVAGVNGDVVIPPCVKNIGKEAFKGRIGLKSVMVPSSVASIGTEAFFDCSGLTSVAIPASVNQILGYAFAGCSGLLSFSVDSDNPSYSARDGMLCTKDGSTLLYGINGDVTIPPSVKEIGVYAFFNCRGLKSVRIQENVTSIAHGAFRGCDSLTSVTIPPRVTSIGGQVFYGCKHLATVTIPSSVTKIEGSAFSCCNELMSFTVDPDNPSYSSRNGLLCTKDGSTLVAGVSGDVTIPSCVQNIADNTFSGCIGLKSVTIPSSVTNIGRQAFNECKELTSVAIPSSVKRIGSRAFTMCHKIKSVTISEGVTSIGEYAFAWCHAIEAVAIPQSVTDIKGNTFAGCGGLKSVTIPNSVTSIGDYSFVGCKGLTSVTIPASVTYVGVGAFYRCGGLKTVALPSSVTSIGKGAFAETPFYNDMPDGLVVLGGGVLCKYKGECPSSVTIPSNVTSIGENAFRACSRLESLTIPSTVTNIDGRAFAECPNLRTVHVVRDGKVETMSFDDFFKRWKNVVAQRLQRCDFLLNKDFKRNAKVYLCLFSASWCGPCRAEMPRIAKTYAETLKGNPNIELIHFSRDQDDGEALAWAKEHDVKFPVVKYNGGNPLNLQTSGIPHLFIVKADGTLVEEGHPMKLFTDEKLRSLTIANEDRKIKGKSTSDVETDGSGNSVQDVEYKFTYKLDNNGNAILTGMPCVSPKPEGVLVVPSIIDGHKVTKLDVHLSFVNCDKMTKIILPAGLESVGFGNFLKGCSSLADIEISKTNPNFTSFKGVLYSKDMKKVVAYPKAREKIELSPQTKIIGREAFSSCTFIKEIVVPSGIERIESHAFGGMLNLEKIVFPESVNEIWMQLFQEDSNLRKIIFMGNAPEVHIEGIYGFFAYAPENIVIEVKKGTKGWNGKDSTDIPERWPKSQFGDRDSRPIRYMKETGSWTVAQYNGSSSMSLADAQRLVEQTSKVAEKTYQTLSFGNSDNGVGNFPHVEFPGTVSSVDLDYFVTTAKGCIYVPYAGDWTFACLSDGGFRFVISGNGLSDTFECGLIALWQGTLLHTVHFPCAGSYTVTGLHFENWGSAGLEYSVARGIHSSFDSSKFKLVGDPESGIVMVGEAKDAGRQVQGEHALRRPGLLNRRPVRPLDSEPREREQAKRGDASAGALARLRERRRMQLMQKQQTEAARRAAANEEKAENERREAEAKAAAALAAAEREQQRVKREQQRAALQQIQEELRRQREERQLQDGQAANAEAQQQQATVGGYTWSYRVKNGEATIVAEKNGKHSCAVSPTPTGDFSIPATLGGVKVTHIGWEAFRYCKELTSVTIPEGVSHIDGHTFDQCYGLKSVTLPSSLKGIGWAAFWGCAELKSIVIPEGVTSIRADTFNGCRSLKNLVIPNSMTHIGERAFLGCRELTEVTIPAKVATIGEGAFGGCSKLKQINLAAGNQSFTLVDGVLYKKDMSVLLACPGTRTSVTIPSGVKIGALAFCGYDGLKSVTLPEGLMNIPWGAFAGCKGLTSVTIPSSVKVIAPDAFKECYGLQSVTICGERSEALNGIFKSCGNLKSIHVPAKAKSWAGMKEWQGIPLVFDVSPSMEEKDSKDLYMIVDLTKTGKSAISYLGDVPKNGWGDEYRTKKIALRKIAPGSFEYLPGKSFKITKPFYIGVFEVTQKQYEMVMKENPSEFKGDMRPVEKVSYINIRGKDKGLNWPKDNQVDADSYLGRLRMRIGIDFDLPTEVQWEYACRAGTKSDLNVDGFELVKLAKCIDNGGLSDHHVKVGSFIPNAWGLYDMHGNVWEWCLDRWGSGHQWGGWAADSKETETDPKGRAEGTSRLLRGGSCGNGAFHCRSGQRASNPADTCFDDWGFRLACPAK